MNKPSFLLEMDRRSRDIFAEIVKTYLETGEPVGSRTISRKGIDLSSASIRNVMSDLCEMGLLQASHASSGRAPTHAGLRVFVDALLQTEDIGISDRKAIDQKLQEAPSAHTGETLLSNASKILSELGGCAGLVASPRRETPIRHVEFVCISAVQALVVIVTEDNEVENRLMDLLPGLPPSALTEAGNYLNARMRGQTLEEALSCIRTELAQKQDALDSAAASLVENGVALWSGEDMDRGRALIVRGRSNLLDTEAAEQDLEHIRRLFDELEHKKMLIDILDSACGAKGIRIFIGSENPLFSLSGSSLVLAPYMDKERKVVGALGVIGPTRINYARVISVVSYTAEALGRLLTGSPRL